jgi:hypothetical protein
MSLETNQLLHPLSSKWVLYAHLPHDTDWSLDSYKKLMDIKLLEDVISLNNKLPDTMITNCMLFLMKNNIKPVWEDDENREGGCFSYKINNLEIVDTWKELSYLLLGETITEDKELLSNINGITVSPKRNFCIVKVWLKNCSYTDSEVLNVPESMSKFGVLFKKHNPDS